ncbi:sialin-like [Schistocerca cancellata]|uniref:sialin-like n=1 Tax=Schistocerca cancellata TaxID=274614 RepID=UPI002118881D|nr:sialin-like [Schistocerca cancellata]
MADCVAARLSASNVLWLLAFCGFALNYAVRVNLNIAIVAMVRRRASAAATAGYCGGGAAQANGGDGANVSVAEGLLVGDPAHNMTANDTTYADATAFDEDGHYDWDEHQQALVLGAFFWLHWSTQVPGAMLARRVGPKLIFGASNLSACLLAALIPLAAGVDYRALVALRALQGLLTGMAWPSMHCMTANWVPPNDRSKFISAYLGSSVGDALTFPVSGVLIGWLSWPAVFYATTLATIVWFLAWWLLVFDHPHHHPRISHSELHYLQVRLVADAASYKLVFFHGFNVTQETELYQSRATNYILFQPATPWGHILTSRQVWLLVLAKWGSFWVLSTLLTQAPTYLRNIHGWSIGMLVFFHGFNVTQETELYQSRATNYILFQPATPWGHILTSRQVWLLVLAKWGSFWVLSTLLTQAPTYLRNIHGWSIGMGKQRKKIGENLGIVIEMPSVDRKRRVGKQRPQSAHGYLLASAALLAGLSYSGCSHGAATAFLVAAVFVNGALATGPLAALVDISPSFCSILLGLTNVVCTLPGFISPAVVGALTYQNQTPAQWRAVFLISAAMAAVPGAVYALLGHAVRQPWDQPPATPADAATSREVTPLQPGGRGAGQ